MISDLIVNGYYYIGSIILGELPKWSLPAIVVSSSKTILADMMMWNEATGGVVFAVLLCMGLMVVFETSIIVWNLIIGFASLIRGSGQPTLK